MADGIIPSGGIAMLVFWGCNAWIFRKYRYGPIDVVSLSINLTVAVIYGISRLGLVVLVCDCFSSMLASAYETVDWTTYIPLFA